MSAIEDQNGILFYSTAVFTYKSSIIRNESFIFAEDLLTVCEFPGCYDCQQTVILQI